MGNFDDINEKIGGQEWEISRPLMGNFEDINGGNSRTLMGQFEAITGKIRGH